MRTSDALRSASAFCLFSLALRSSASLARLASISALLFSDILFLSSSRYYSISGESWWTVGWLRARVE